MKSFMSCLHTFIMYVVELCKGAHTYKMEKLSSMILGLNIKGAKKEKTKIEEPIVSISVMNQIKQHRHKSSSRYTRATNEKY